MMTCFDAELNKHNIWNILMILQTIFSFVTTIIQFGMLMHRCLFLFSLFLPLKECFRRQTGIEVEIKELYFK